MKKKFENFWAANGADLLSAGTNKFSAYAIWLSALEAGDEAVPMVGETTQEEARPFKVGDRVESTYYGEGTILEDDGSSYAPLHVKFEDGYEIYHHRDGKDNVGRGRITHLD